jgi:two-component system, NarL family, invasion response regulator UvrY
VVLMDLFMPGAGGLAATREILAVRPSAQVVAMSASNEEGVISSVLDAGASGFLSKTCSFEQLIAAVRNTGVGAIP